MLRPLTKSDLPQILVIEQAVHVAPWNMDTFKTCFDAGYVGWVLERDKQIIGFIVVSIKVEECHILNIGVPHAYQHQGIGTQLLEHAISEAKKQNAAIVYLEVRVSNAPAIAMYQKMHFYQIGERKNYYPTPAGQEDAFVFARSLV
ncbi:MAG: ribosomal protein S18-alanine N-acetyltransferase [Gammaproteobacteria bacterium]